jgi:DNA-binding HxlR family transcriptional regulator
MAVSKDGASGGVQYLCGLDASVDVIGGKWKVLLLWALREGPRRYGELKREVTGISEKMLVQQLRQMEADGLVEREVFHEVPPRVDYRLTALGESLNEALRPLGDWGEKHMERIATARERQIAASGGATG